ncbi:MAG: hypothetical protein HQL75_02920 [Magnetococcales bacterium]|nr:hypothetical protein [Magnetococcales bacterium]
MSIKNNEFISIMHGMATNPLGGMKLPESGDDKLGIVARAFNKMADSVRVLARGLEEKTAEQERSTREIKTLARHNNLILQANSEGIDGVGSGEKTTFIFRCRSGHDRLAGP